MAIGWKDGVNPVIDGLVARLVTLENQIKELIEDKAAKTKKIDDLEKELRTASNNSSTSSNNLTSVNDSWANILKGNNKMNEVQTNILNVVGNEQNQRRRKERNVILFGVPASKAVTTDLQTKEDKETIKAIFTEIGYPNDADAMVSLTRLKLNPSKTTTNPPPLRMTLADFSYNNVTIEEILSAARKLKESEKFKKVFINKDLTTVEIVQLKQLIATRNDLNKKLEASNGTSSIATYRYGIRNDRVVKVALEKRLIN
jgi:hypothetical protein